MSITVITVAYIVVKGSLNDPPFPFPHLWRPLRPAVFLSIRMNITGVPDLASNT